MKTVVDQLRSARTLPPRELRALLTHDDAQTLEYINGQAREVAQAHFGNNIYIRGLIEISNCCRNDCYYCGIRKSNRNIARYRLSKESILNCCEEGYQLGFRTFVMQGGEDPAFLDDQLIDLVETIRKRYPDCAITLSVGEKPRHTYERLFEAGANRYLLRHETYTAAHYSELHPAEMLCENRIRCLETLKEIGFQTGTGIMVGTPGQTIEHLIAVLLLSIFRLMHPAALIPSTTALATLSPDGRERGILAGANVVMPNLSPREERKKYELYNNKASLGAEAAEGLLLLDQQLATIGYRISKERGDFNP